MSKKEIPFKELSLKFAQQRLDNKLTIEELANKAGVGCYLITCIEMPDFSDVKIDELVKVAVALGCTLDVSFKDIEKLT